MLFLMLLLLGLVSCAPSHKTSQHARVTLISEDESLNPAGANWIGLRFQLDPGWHIYWVNPGDSGEPPKVAWRLPSEFKAGELQFPTPSRIHDHSLIDYGYEKNAVLLAQLTVLDSSRRSAVLSADVRYLVCREVCIPGDDTVSLKMPLGGNGRLSSDADLIRKIQRQLPQALPRGVVLSGKSNNDQFLLRISSKAPFGLVKDFFPLDPGQVENTFIPQIDHRGETTEITLRKSEQLSQPIQSLRGILIIDDKAYAAIFPISPAAQASSRASSH